MAEGRREGSATCPVVRLCGWSGSGKTALGVGLLRALRRAGLRVGVVKHAASGFDLGRPGGTDSDRYLRAGAAAVVLCGPAGAALLMHGAAPRRLPPSDLSGAAAVLAAAAPTALDLILAEGFKRDGDGGAAIVVHDQGRDPPPVAGRVIARVTPGRRGAGSEAVSVVARLVIGELGGGR